MPFFSLQKNTILSFFWIVPTLAEKDGYHFWAVPTVPENR